MEETKVILSLDDEILAKEIFGCGRKVAVVLPFPRKFKFYLKFLYVSKWGKNYKRKEKQYAFISLKINSNGLKISVPKIEGEI